MHIIDPSYIVIDKIDGEEILKKIEKCGRICYKSEDRITDDSCKKFVAGLIKSGHESVLEHVSITVIFIISRAIANEIVDVQKAELLRIVSDIDILKAISNKKEMERLDKADEEKEKQRRADRR